MESKTQYFTPSGGLNGGRPSHRINHINGGGPNHMMNHINGGGTHHINGGGPVHRINHSNGGESTKCVNTCNTSLH